MGNNDDITLAKGALSVTLFTLESAENFKNTLTRILPVTTPDNQDSGANKETIVDVLRISRTFSFDCGITATATKTAKQVKDNLKNIFNGANVTSSTVTLTYEDESIGVFIEDMVIKKIKNDDVVGSGYTGKDSMEYRVTITAVEGKLVG